MGASEAWNAVTQVTSDLHERGSMMVGAALESSCQSVRQYGGGPGCGMWQIEAAEGGSHYGEITIADAMNPLTAARFMLPDYRAACRDIGDGDYQSDPAHAYAEAAFRAERPAQMYPESRIQAAWQLVAPFIVGSSTTGSTTSVVTNYDLVRVARAHVGETYNDMTLDPWNRSLWGDKSPWAGECEAFGEGVPAFLGVPVVHHADAAECVDAVQAQGLAQTSWPPKHGAACGWGRTFDQHGHRCWWDAEREMFITTIITPPSVGYYYSDFWRNALACWWEVPGVTYLDAAPAPPVPPEYLIPNNPYGPIPLKAPFATRWQALDTLGLALPQIGYAMAPETTVNGRRVQRFERGWLGTQNSPAPFDVVMLTDSDRTALIAPQPATAPATPVSGAPTGQPARH